MCLEKKTGRRRKESQKDDSPANGFLSKQVPEKPVFGFSE